MQLYKEYKTKGKHKVVIFKEIDGVYYGYLKSIFYGDSTKKQLDFYMRAVFLRYTEAGELLGYYDDRYIDYITTDEDYNGEYDIC